MVFLWLLLLFWRSSCWSLNATLLSSYLTNYTITPLVYNNQTYLLLFGVIGKYASTLSNTLYIFQYSNKTFVNLTSLKTGPAIRARGCSAVIEDTFYYFGGSNATYFYNDLWGFNITTKVWKSLMTIGNFGKGQLWDGGKEQKSVHLWGRQEQRHT